ncbi:hypothetical protein SOVF_032760 [Spinacia oleracea]|uniref:non-specific serine/threonine protein kinase n=1 Tax=Spinacia oleracea TaxID=3562 RepID=A0A9R0IU33_SPIOL|nr:serine/threonine-protein kinase WNK8-like [Spinacia oleracea]KNA22587.1 hypothetical protein SOVF_032760 [Spinacia oleracea]
MAASSSQEEGNTNYAICDRDLVGQFVRYGTLLGTRGGDAEKVVFKGFDGINGLEIAWSETLLTKDMLKNEKYVESLCNEHNLMKPLVHDNIVRCYDSWVDFKEKRLYMITEPSTSGNLLDYLQKHFLEDDIAIKSWCIQILRGLEYLHNQNPPIIHRDVKFENIFINGNTCTVKLGDFSLAMILGQKYSADTFETPLFIAPEVSVGEPCHESVDIYSFGMCVLQMITLEIPYREYVNKYHARMKASSGIMPDSLRRVADPAAKQFIERCLAPASDRPTATVLLDDPFLAQTTIPITPTNSQSLTESFKVVPGQVDKLLPKTFWLRGTKVNNNNNDNAESDSDSDSDSILLTLWIKFASKSEVVIENVYSSESDTIQGILAGIATEHGFSAAEVVTVTQLMDTLIPVASSDSGHRFVKYYEISCQDRVVKPVYQLGLLRGMLSCFSCKATTSTADQ